MASPRRCPRRCIQTYGSGDHSGGDDSGPGGGGDDNGQGDDQNENNQACTTANLTPGASVGAAELRISSDGSVWQRFDLIS